jgi:hypothetical protein
MSQGPDDPEGLPEPVDPFGDSSDESPETPPSRGRGIGPRMPDRGSSSSAG